MSRKQIFVLGAGPAGLLAAEAAHERGYEVQVVSKPGPAGKPAKSQLYGCQYLHAPVPRTLPFAGHARKVDYMLVGSSDGYRDKVYGRDYIGPVSPDEFGPMQNHEAWDIRRVYDELWLRWSPSIMPVRITPQKVEEMLGYKVKHVLSTIPATMLCTDEEHKFPAAQIWAFGESPNRISPISIKPFTVVCNGEPGQAWYRAANVFGYTTVEWPASRKPPIDGVVPVFKPLRTDCDCWLKDSRFKRLGRFGKWQKGVLVHEAYEEALRLL